MANPSPSASLKTARLLSAAANDNPTVVKAGNGTVTRIRLRNNKAAAVYLKLYDKATAPGAADTPRKTIYIAASSDYDSGLIEDYYGAGIGFRITGAAADADNTALVAADVVCVNVDYR